jgi:MFS transporter, SP family, general alpha glucoside:H+ symporter
MASPEKREDVVGAPLEEHRTEEPYSDTKVLNEEARQATATEHSLTFWQAIKTYKRAAFWSIRM